MIFFWKKKINLPKKSTKKNEKKTGKKNEKIRKICDRTITVLDSETVIYSALRRVWNRTFRILSNRIEKKIHHNKYNNYNNERRIVDEQQAAADKTSSVCLLLFAGYEFHSPI